MQLPLPSAWNGRFMMQGGGGSEGSVPTATGTIGGSPGIPEVANGYATASQGMAKTFISSTVGSPGNRSSSSNTRRRSWRSVPT